MKNISHGCCNLNHVSCIPIFLPYSIFFSALDHLLALREVYEVCFVSSKSNHVSTWLPKWKQPWITWVQSNSTKHTTKQNNGPKDIVYVWEDAAAIDLTYDLLLIRPKLLSNAGISLIISHRMVFNGDYLEFAVPVIQKYTTRSMQKWDNGRWLNNVRAMLGCYAVLAWWHVQP